MTTLIQTCDRQAPRGTGIGEIDKAESDKIGTQSGANERPSECALAESNPMSTVQPSSLPVTVYMENMVKEHILVVDDEQNMLNTLAFILEAANYRVTTATEGREALEEIVAARDLGSPIDLLITDMRLPGLTGLQLIDELNYLKMKIPTLVITAYRDRPMVLELMRAGCTDYLDKPFDYKELVRRVDRLVAKQ